MTKSLREVDFAVERAGERALVQSCASLADPATRERELAGLGEAMAESGIRDAAIVTTNEEGTARVDKRAVRIVPAWRWLLE